MIFDTIAAMAQWNNNKKFDFQASATLCRANLVDVANTGTKTVINDQTISGVMGVTNETLTINGVAKVNAQYDWFSQHIRGLETKAPRSVVEAAMTNVVY